MKDLLSKEHHCYTIHTFLMKSSAYPPPFYRPSPYMNYSPHFYKKIQNDIQNALKILKEVLPSLIYLQQTAYVQNRHAGESGRLIVDRIEIVDVRNMNAFLVIPVTEKPFDSLDDKFPTMHLDQILFCG